MFFCSEIQATDSTCTGCRAKRAAASGGPGNLEPPQDAEQQDGAEAVQEDVDEVIAGDGVAPEAVLHPERRVQQRVVLLGRAEVGPDPPEARPVNAAPAG